MAVDGWGKDWNFKSLNKYFLKIQKKIKHKYKKNTDSSNTWIFQRSSVQVGSVGQDTGEVGAGEAN